LQKKNLLVQKQNFLQFFDICGNKKWKDKKIFSPPLSLLLLLDLGSEIRDPG